jgi:hypothetical protein
MAESQKAPSKGLRAEDCFSKELRALGLIVKEAEEFEGCELRG